MLADAVAIGELLGPRRARDDGERNGDGDRRDAEPVHSRAYRGMLSCFFHGFSSVLLRSIAKPRAMRRRVVDGMMTSSI